jgi:hypothetical protein
MVLHKQFDQQNCAKLNNIHVYKTRSYPQNFYVIASMLGVIKISINLLTQKLRCHIVSGVNFINIKRTNFSYAHWFRQLFSSYMYVAETTFVRKICMFNIDEIDGWRHKMCHLLAPKNVPKSTGTLKKETSSTFYAVCFKLHA